MTLAAHAFTQLAGWPDLAEVTPSCGTGRALGTAHSEIIHFHSDRAVDLHLTVRAIRRFEDHLDAARAVQVVRGSAWVTVHLDTPADVHLLTTLVTLALQAHQRWPNPGDASQSPCNDHHSEVRPRENLGGS
ncbi:luciferase family protein [Streptomyces sp. NPDC101175]|uniref:luciferase domain-containing protein n=1 Tax=Streptomyces sp. NPDC101175 TaxID=3366123 RepID=UPI003837D8CD